MFNVYVNGTDENKMAVHSMKELKKTKQKVIMQNLIRRIFFSQLLTLILVQLHLDFYSPKIGLPRMF